MIMSITLGVWCIFAALLYRIWLSKRELKDYFIVEWRTLHPEGADLFSDWSSLSVLTRASMSARGMNMDGSMIMRNAVHIGTRSLKVWQTPELAHFQFDYYAKDIPPPYCEACLAILWGVRASGDEHAKELVLQGYPMLLRKSSPKRVELEVAS